MKRKEVLAMESIAYYSGLNGLEIKDINDERVVCVSGAWGGKKQAHNVKLEWTGNGKPFFRVHGYRIPLDECMRMGAF